MITGRNVNPGDEVLAGQQLMALRSLTDIWIDANFKETQLARLRIGSAPTSTSICMVAISTSRDAFPDSRWEPDSTLALLPAENATGNYVKVVQRLPVRIDLSHYNPDAKPLFLGLVGNSLRLYRRAHFGSQRGQVPSIAASGAPD